MNKKVINLLGIVVILGFSALTVNAQSLSEGERMNLCEGDIDLVESAFAYASGDSAGVMLDSGSMNEVKTVLDQYSDLDTRSQISAVLVACAKGEILLDRFGG